MMPRHRVKDLAATAVAAEYFRLKAKQAEEPRRTEWNRVAFRLDRLVAETIAENRPKEGTT